MSQWFITSNEIAAAAITVTFINSAVTARTSRRSSLDVAEATAKAQRAASLDAASAAREADRERQELIRSQEFTSRLWQERRDTYLDQLELIERRSNWRAKIRRALYVEDLVGDVADLAEDLPEHDELLDAKVEAFASEAVRTLHSKCNKMHAHYTYLMTGPQYRRAENTPEARTAFETEVENLAADLTRHEALLREAIRSDLHATGRSTREAAN